MSQNKFKYDIVTLIKLVESKPYLWDKTNKDNKNKIKRKKSWQDIFEYLEDGYDQMSLAEKKKVGESIVTKWSYIRDSFIRSLRPTSDGRSKKNYMYAEHLQFLLRGNLEDPEAPSEDYWAAQSVVTEFLPNTQSTMCSQPGPGLILAMEEGSPSKANKRNRPRQIQLDIVGKETLSELKKARTDDRSDQELMMLSFVPYISDMSTSELMELHVDVLMAIKSIKERRNLNNPPSTE